MKPPRSDQALEQIRESMIDAALAIIMEEGFTSLTMRRLATRMRMSAANLYNYFRSKDEIYLSIVIQGFRMLKKALDKAYRSSRSPARRARAMMEAYVRFGIENKAYYDIMFTRPTPKYNDYVDTPYEKLSGIEMKISMDIAGLAMDALNDLWNRSAPLSEEETVHHIVKIWSLLHGMVSLSNSNIIGYVAHDMEKTYSRIMDELIEQYNSKSR
jgi:AcrR family transcriptional regulator